MQGAAVDAGVGANFHVVANAHRAELLNLLPALAVRCKAKTVCANDYAAVHKATRPHHAIFTHSHACAQLGARANLGAALDDAQGADAGGGVNGGLRVDHGRRVNGWRVLLGARSTQSGAPELGQAGKVQIRLVGNDAGAPTQGGFLEQRPYDNAGRLGAGKLLLVAGVADEADLARAGGLQRRQAGNWLIAVPMQFAAQRGDDGGKP